MQEITKDVIERLIAIKEGPCISVYMPTKAAASVEVKNAYPAKKFTEYNKRFTGKTCYRNSY